MKCPHCGGVRSSVENTRPDEHLETVRRFRRCIACRKRFRTHEVYVPEEIASELRHMSHESFLRVLCQIRINRIAILRGRSGDSI